MDISFAILDIALLAPGQWPNSIVIGNQRHLSSEDSVLQSLVVNFAVTQLSGTDRSQLLLLPEAVNDYVGPGNPVRFIEAFVGHEQRVIWQS